MNVELSPVLVAITDAVLPGLLYAAGTAAVAILTPLSVKWFGQKNTALLQQQADAVLNHAIGYAVSQSDELIKQQGYTMEVKNTMAQLAAQYVITHDKDLAARIGEVAGQLEQKALARMASHPDVQAAVAGISPPDASNDNAPAHPAAAA